MSAKHIDEVLALWHSRLGNAAQNLIDLQSEPVYKRINAPDSKLSGETAEKGALAVRTLSSLLQYFDLLQSTVARAEELRRDMPALFGAEERERQILALLAGKSIHLPAVQVPLGKRSLLMDVENVDVISPPDLLAVMEAAFESVKQIILRINTAWETLGFALNDAFQLSATLGENTGVLSTADRLDLEQKTARLRALERSATEDPLGVAAGSVVEVKKELEILTAKVEDAKRQHGLVRNALHSARNLLSSLGNEHEAVRNVCAEARTKAGFTPDGQSNDWKLEGLTVWFNRLVTASESSPPASLLVAFSNWTKAAEELRREESALAAQAKISLSARSELRGRLDALKAKARAFALAENR